MLACYDLNGVYRSTGGVNLVAGMIVWLFLGGWLSGSSALTFAAGQTLFQYISATLPSMIVAGALYVVAAKVFFAKRTMGGYPFSRTAPTIGPDLRTIEPASEPQRP